MFGNLTEQPKSSDPNGFLALAIFDLNEDGWIDQDEAEKGQLLLWQDANHNGISEPGELHSFKELGVERISLHYHKDRHVDPFGNLFRYAAAMGDESHDHRVYDVILRYVDH